MQVEHASAASASKAWPLIVEGVNELVQEGLLVDRCGFPVNWDDQVLYAVSREGDVVGAVCYRKESWSNGAHISLGYVEPSSRRQGVYRLLFAALVERGKAEGLVQITGTVDAKNDAMQKTMAALGRKLTRLTYAFDL